MRSTYAPRAPLAQELRYVARIQRQSTVPDEFNQPVLSWDTLASVRASVRAESGREFETSQQMQGERMTLISIRAVPGLTILPQYRVLVSIRGVDRAYNVHEALDDQERGLWVFLRCTDGTNGG